MRSVAAFGLLARPHFRVEPARAEQLQIALKKLGASLEIVDMAGGGDI